MLVSVLIPTYKRVQDLKRCLHGLSQQERLADEILIVVRDIDIDTQDFLNSFHCQNLNLRQIFVSEPGQVSALNAGIEAVNGDIVSITDDDTIPHKNWLYLIERHFQSDSEVGGIGGRDLIHENDKPIDGESFIVGKVQWFGRVIGNHHLGVGPAREVDWLKGANMSYRKAAISDLRFDVRLKGKGAQGSNDLAFCLELKRKGWKILYDPMVAVNHYPSIRFGSNERHSALFSNEDAYHAEVYNQARTLLKHFNSFQKLVYLLWAILIGTRANFGMVQVLRFMPKNGKITWKRWLIALNGYKNAFIDHFDSGVKD
jgi:glycosyltransferase involved in cell wall biosynthesis